MKPSIRLLAGVSAIAAGGAVVLGATGAPAQPGSAAQAKKVSHRGVGQVHIGMRYSKARAMGLVGPRIEGCPLEDIDSASLRAPLTGFVDLSTTTPQRISRITVRGGARARGVRVGSPRTAVLAAFPGATVQPLPDFNVTVVRVPKAAGGRFDLILGSGPRERVRSFEVRRFTVCD